MPDTIAMTSKGQVTIPKRIRDSLHLKPGQRVRFDVATGGDIVIRAATQVSALRGRAVKTTPVDRFEAVRGKASVAWKTEDLMRLLRD